MYLISDNSVYGISTGPGINDYLVSSKIGITPSTAQTIGCSSEYIVTLDNTGLIYQPDAAGKYLEIYSTHGKPVYKYVHFKDLFDWSHNTSHSSLYPDVLKIKNNNYFETKFLKMPFLYNLQIHIWLLCGMDVLASGWPDHRFVNL